MLLITLVAAFIAAAAGLSLVLGAFLAGMLISETEYHFQVEQDIKPFRDVLLGLFFVTVGMLLDPRLVVERWGAVLVFVLLLMLGKFALIAALSRAFGTATGTALRVALALAQGGEFGFVLLALAGIAGIVPEPLLQPMLAAMIVSMLATPFVIAASDRIVLRLSRAEWMQRSLELHRIAVQSIEAERHVVIGATAAMGSASRASSTRRACATSRSTSIRSACAKRPRRATRWCSPTACGARR